VTGRLHFVVIGRQIEVIARTKCLGIWRVYLRDWQVACNMWKVLGFARQLCC